MEQDDRLREIFEDYKPNLGDSSQFMASLQQRLEAVEYLRQMQEAETRHYHRVTLATLVAGMVAGGAMVAALLLWPGDVPMLTLGLPGLAQVVTPEAMRLLCIIGLSLLLGVLTMATTCVLLPSTRTEMPDATRI